MLPRQGAVWWRGWERRQLPVLFFPIFFFSLCHAAATSYRHGITSNARMNARLRIGRLRCHGEGWTFFWGARAGLQLTCPSPAPARGTKKSWRGNWQKGTGR